MTSRTLSQSGHRVTVSTKRSSGSPHDTNDRKTPAPALPLPQPGPHSRLDHRTKPAAQTPTLLLPTLSPRISSATDVFSPTSCRGCSALSTSRASTATHTRHPTSPILVSFHTGPRSPAARPEPPSRAHCTSSELRAWHRRDRSTHTCARRVHTAPALAHCRLSGADTPRCKAHHTPHETRSRGHFLGSGQTPGHSAALQLLPNLAYSLQEPDTPNTPPQAASSPPGSSHLGVSNSTLKLWAPPQKHPLLFHIPPGSAFF